MTAPGKPIGVTLLYDRGSFGLGATGAGYGVGHGRRANEPEIRIGQPTRHRRPRQDHHPSLHQTEHLQAHVLLRLTRNEALNVGR